MLYFALSEKIMNFLKDSGFYCVAEKETTPQHGMKILHNEIEFYLRLPNTCFIPILISRVKDGHSFCQLILIYRVKSMQIRFNLDLTNKSSIADTVLKK